MREPAFQAGASREALKHLTGDVLKANSKPPRAHFDSNWKRVKELVRPERLDLPAVRAVKAFQHAGRSRRQQPQQRTYTSNSKYFVIKTEKWESHEDADLSIALMSPRVALQAQAPLAVIGLDSSKDYATGEAESPRCRRRRRLSPPKEAMDAKWGLKVDAIDSHLHKLDMRTMSRQRVLCPTVEISHSIDQHLSARNRSTTMRRSGGGEGRLPSYISGANEARRSTRNLKDKKGNVVEVDQSDAGDSDDGSWLREEDAINIPSDADLEAMPVMQASAAMLYAQHRVIQGLGRVEEPWDVRLQRKQEAMRLLSPNKALCVPLFESNNFDHNENASYTTQRTFYLLSKISELKRKQKMVAYRQEQQLASLSDGVEIEKRRMLMQILDLEREERRLRFIMRKMDDRQGGGEKLSAEDV